MSGFTKLQKLLLAGLGTCGSALAFYYSFHGEKRQAYASWTTNHNPSVQWDSNWDRRDPSCLVDPRKNGTDENKYNEALKKAKPKAVRHLLLIRHGQYNLSGRIDEERKLTDLGRKQAHFTGLRLQELDLPYSKLIASTMTRANETARIIQRSLPEVPFSDCPLLEEGAPIPPEPPVGNWRPEPCVRFDSFIKMELESRQLLGSTSTEQKILKRRTHTKYWCAMLM
ncbi:Serine/threonine-protein phosphatase Pgam5 [Blattella germanica]|nr:Serine/threonine-protein phosphatase Pgam5 [Blattella germanica]